LALTVRGVNDEAMAAAEGLLAAADSADNPRTASFGLLAYGWAYNDADPAAAYGALRRGLTISQESGNRQMVSGFAIILSRLAATHGDTMDAFEFLTVAICHCYDSGSFSILPTPLAILAGLLDRLGQHEPAATIFGFASTTVMRFGFPEINTAIVHLPELLGDKQCEALALAGQNMTATAEAVAYALEQIDRARAEIAN
jgi:hypothetical protein